MLFSFLLSLAITFFAIKFLYPFSIKIQLVDCPDERKQHSGNIPLIGGIAIFIGFSVTMLFNIADLNQIRGLLIATLVVVIVGVLDDFFNISFKKRFIFQIGAALVMTSLSGVILGNLGDLAGNGDIILGNWAIPFTVFAAIGMMNAINMIDGVDGLAGTTTLITIASLFLLHLFTHTVDIKLTILMGTIIAFLWFNLRSSQKIFMGDSGSMFLGLVIVWILIQSSQGSDAIISPVTALWLVGLPLIDTVAIMFRRVLKGQSPFLPDREHIHHIFQRAGYSNFAILIIVGLFSSLLAAIGIFSQLMNFPEWLMFLMFLTLFALYLFGIRHAWVFLKLLKSVK